MQALMKYNNYTYRPGKLNLFDPVELANLKAVDERIDKITARERRNQKAYYERNKAKILARNKAYLERRKADHADKEATP